MNFRSVFTSLCMAALVVSASFACSRDTREASDVLAQDSTLARDLALAGSDAAVEPELKDVPSTPPPARAPAPPAPEPKPKPAPAPAPAPAPKPTPAPAPAPVVTPSGNVVEAPKGSGSTEGRLGVVSAGTSLALSAGQRVCTNTNSIGDRFTATLSQAVTASNGVVIPAGATAVVEVTSLKRSEQAGDDMGIELAVKSISYGGKTYPISAQIASADVEKVRAEGGNDAGKVLGGAAVGAILGRVLGGKNKTKGTVIGAAGGAAAGAVLANQTKDYDACIPVGGKIAIRLNQPISVQGAPTTTQTPSTSSDGI